MQRRDQKDRRQQREPKEFDEEVVQIDRVTRVVKGGRKLRFRATVVIGNRKGKVGVGIGKSHEVTGAIQKAIAKAKKNLIKVILDENTIPHDIRIKYKSAKLLLMPAGPGTGIIAGGPVRKVVELAGIKDILSKRFGTTNKVTNTKAAFEALKLLLSTPLMDKKRIKREKPAVTASQKPVTPAAKKETPKKEEKQPITTKES